MDNKARIVRGIKDRQRETELTRGQVFWAEGEEAEEFMGFLDAVDWEKVEKS
jgi:hypothetical protein